MSKIKIGFIGQGFIGKNYSDDFEKRGHKVVRYAKEKPYDANKEEIKKCDIVFIAVPTPTTPKGYDASIIKAVLPLTKKGGIVVLKSTIFPGLTKEIQKEFEETIGKFKNINLNIRNDNVIPECFLESTPKLEIDYDFDFYNFNNVEE